MTTDHDRLRRLTLVFEDLEGEELAEAAQHLTACAGCADLRARVLDAEARMRAVPGLAAAPDPLAGLSPGEQAAAWASREALLSGTFDRARTRRWPGLLPMALAAVAAFLVFVPALTHRGPVRELQLGSPLVLRGGEGADRRAGVSFRLTRPGFPVLLHVDAGGRVRLLHPAPGGPDQPVTAGPVVLLPPPERGDDWRSGLTPGCGTYLLALATERPPTPAQLAALATPATRGDPRGAVREAARRLRGIAGKVERLADEGCH